MDSNPAGSGRSSEMAWKGIWFWCATSDSADFSECETLLSVTRRKIPVSAINAAIATAILRLDLVGAITVITIVGMHGEYQTVSLRFCWIIRVKRLWPDTGCVRGSQLFVAEGDYWIYHGGATGWEEAGQQGHPDQDH